MEQRRWINQSQPQTLQIAVFLLYINAAFIVLFAPGALFNRLGFVLIAGQVAAGYGISNERKWGYGLGVAMAFLPFLWRIWVTGSLGGALSTDVISLMFEIALIALLLHPQSREYQRIWFK